MQTQLRDFLRSGYLFPAIAAVAAIGIIAFGLTNWILKRNQRNPFIGRAAAGTYYRILPDFSCQSRRIPQALMNVTEAGFATTSVNPFDCSAVTWPLPEAAMIDVALDGKRIGYKDAIFEKFDKEPNIMDAVPKKTELWCRPRNDEAAPLDLFAVGDMDEWTLEVWRGGRRTNQTVEVYEPVRKPVVRQLIGSRLKFETEGYSFDADLKSTLPNGALSGHGKLHLDDQFIDQELVCRSTLRPGLICPMNYGEVPPHELYLAQPVCMSQSFNGTVDTRNQALESCRKLGPGFDLTREEEWLAANKSRQPLGWLTNGSGKEWTKDGSSEAKSQLPFRCVFHPVAETGATIFPLTYSPSNETGEGRPIEVGVRFRSAQKGFVKGIRFYRLNADPAGYTVHLWDSAGKALATASTTDPGNVPGWQTVMFAEPVAIEDSLTRTNIYYVASYYTAAGHVAIETSGLQSERSRGLGLTALAGGGVFITNGGFPTNSGPETVNYGVDVIFE